MNRDISQLDEFCNKIPVQHLDFIQSYGILLVIDKTDFTIIQVSENIDQVLQNSPDQLLGHKISDFPDYFILNQISTILEKIQQAKPLIQHQVFQVDDHEVIVHEYEKYYMIEYLVVSMALDSLNPHLFLPSFNVTIEDPSTIQSLYRSIQTLIEQTKAILHFDKILVYQFLDDGHGKVVAEIQEEGMESYLGLHFPASDVPLPVKELYLKTPIRIIYDALASPVSLCPTINPITHDLLDLSDCLLRGVSSIHQEYIQNMHVRTSMSYAIIVGEHLWGLISFHHRKPKILNYQNRIAVGIVAAQISNLCTLFQTSHQSRLTNHQLIVLSHLFESLTKTEGKIDTILSRYQTELIELFNATGAAIYYQKQISLIKETPTQKEIEELIHWLNTYQEDSIFNTDTLPTLFTQAKSYKDKACGLLSIRFHQKTNEYLLLFRPEQIFEVNWGGDPTRHLTVTPHLQLKPRKSFAIWQEQISDHASPWLTHEINAANLVRNKILSFLFNYQFIEKLAAEVEAFHLKIAADKASEGVFLLNGDGKIKWMNAWLKNLFTFQKIEQCQGSFFDLISNSFSISTNEAEQLKGALSSPVPSKVEFLIDKPDGRQFLLLILNPYEHDGKKISGILSDITVMKTIMITLEEKTKELEVANTNLKELNKQKDNFLRMAAHDLRNPLATILTATSVIESGKQPPEVCNKLLSLISRQSKFMLKLLNETLSINLNITSNLTINTEETNLTEFIQQIYEFNQMLASEKHIRLLLATNIEKVICQLDKVKVKQVIDNLLSNAIKYSNPNTTIQFRVTETPTLLHIEVEDQGIGIPLEEQPYIFTPGLKSSNQPTQGEYSYSLGLIICKQIITAYKGNIGFTSIPGKGSTFYFEIPL